MAIGVGLVACYTVLLSWAMGVFSYGIWGMLIVVPAVTLVNALLLWLAIRVERDRVVTRILLAGFLLKGVGIIARYLTVFGVYDGAGDAARYHKFATEHYTAMRDGAIVWEAALGQGGTQNLELITTAIYTVTGPSPLAGFFVFGSMGFWGTYLLYRAFRIAVPDGQHHRYAALVLLMPSLLFWPSSIGKDAWLLFFVGLFALGAARFFRDGVRGLPYAVGGVLGVAIIRPHIAVLLVAAAALAHLLRPTDKSPTAFLAKLIGAALMVAALAYFIGAAADSLGLAEVTTESVTERVQTAAENTEQGGSAFVPVPLTSPLGVPAAIVTLLFRPFPWEGRSALMVLQSLEGLVLLALTIRAWPQLRQLPGALRWRPYLAFSVAYALAFIIAFSGFANVGILARQRVLMLPFFFVVLALPANLSRTQTLQSGAVRAPDGSEVAAR